jgi:lysophospholipase L1-like esterase
VRIVTNGDSITVGVGAGDESAGGYPARLDALLGPGFTVRPEAVSGATLLQRGRPSFRDTTAVPNTLAADPDIVTIMLGTNDSKASNWTANRHEFVDDYVSLIDNYYRELGEVMIHPVLPPPATDVDVRGSVVANEILPGILEAARRRGLNVIDVHSAFGDSPLAFFTDGVHPNDAGHQLIAERMRDGLVGGRVLRPLSAAWQRHDIGATGLAGADALDADGSVVVLGAGAAVGGRADAFRFASQTSAGDASVSARVSAVENVDPLTGTRADAAAGVMIRESLGRDARHAAVMVTAAEGVSFRWRDAKGAAGGAVTVANVRPPVWLRLEREGDDFTALYSADGANWTQIGATRRIAIPVAAHAGLATQSGSNSVLARGRFDLPQIVRQPAGTPDAPVALQAQATAGTVTLTWPAAPGAATYRVLRANTLEGPFTERGVASAGTTTFSDGGVNTNTTYYYIVVPEDDVGQGPATTILRVGPPEAPNGLAAEMIAFNQARLTWNPRDDATSYRVKRATGNGSFVTIGTATEGATSYVDGAALPGVRYRYVVSAVNGSGESAASAVASPEAFGLNPRPSGTRPTGGRRAWPVTPAGDFMSRP